MKVKLLGDNTFSTHVDHAINTPVTNLIEDF